MNHLAGYLKAICRALWTRGMSIDAISERLGIDAGAVETIMGGEK